MNRTVSARVSALTLAAAALVALAGCADGGAPAATDSPAATSAPAAPASAADCDGVFVTVQYGVLGGNRADACVAASAPLTAAAALRAAHFRTEGTAQYGDLVVCRVNGAPAASSPFTVPGQKPYTEKCQGMPPAFAYWAMWVRPSADGQWGYAESGVGTQQLKPGQTLGLKFTTGTDTTPPQG
jgi:hypothetical protein